MTKTDADYEAEYEQDRLLRVKDAEARIAANEAIAANGTRVARIEIERQLTDVQAWLDAYEAQLPIVKDTLAMLGQWGTLDPNVAFKRVMALANIREWLAREEAHAKVYKNRLAVLTSRLESL